MYVNIFIYYVCVSSMYHLKKVKRLEVCPSLPRHRLSRRMEARCRAPSLGLGVFTSWMGKIWGKDGETPWNTMGFLMFLANYRNCWPKTRDDDCRNLPHMAQEPGWPVGSTNLQASDDISPGGETVQDPSKFQFTIQVLQGPFSCSRWIATAVGTFNPYWIERWYSMDKYLG